MNISLTHPTSTYTSKITFKSNNVREAMQNKPANNANNKKPREKQNLWKYVSIGALIVALIADIIVEHKIRIENKNIKKEKELTDKFIKDLQEQSKNLEKEIKKQKEQIDNLKQGGNNSNKKAPDINVDPSSKKQ